MSSRKVKINFSIGERVLCYEPDPTKAKVLYDSKILQVNITQDNIGRKVPEYLVHFLGWSNNWDRIVNEDFLLRDTEENRRLQDRLANEAGVCLKRKWRGSFPFKPKNGKKLEEAPDEQPNLVNNIVVNNVQTRESTSESDFSDDETERVVKLPIPEPLEDILRKDFEYITEKKKLAKLPCQENVLSILESYVKHAVTKNLCPQKKRKSARKKVFNDVETEINFYKEVADGIRLYFDFTLPHLLLYQQEVQQFLGLKNDLVSKEETKEEYKNLEESMKKETPDKYSLRQRRCKSISQKCPSPNENGGTETSKFEDCLLTIHSRSSTPKAKKPKLMGIKHSLRSAHKVQPSENSGVHNNSESLELCMNNNAILNHCESSSSPSSVQNTTPNQLVRTPLSSPVPHSSLCSKSLQRTSLSSESSNFESSSSCLSPLTISASSLEPCVVVSRMEDSPKLSSVNSALLKDILKWKIIPEEEIVKCDEPLPSAVYGGCHLLRLFTKFPGLLCKVPIPSRKFEQLIFALRDFLDYMSLKKNDFFSSENYIDAEDR